MVIGIAMVKDEADIIATTIRRMATQLDGLLVADNQSTDGTREILDELANDLPLTVIDDPDPAYYQSVKMTHLADVAREQLGARWVVPFDADEIWLSRDRCSINELLANTPEHVLAAEALLFDHVATADDGDDTDPVKRLRWRRAAPAPLRKVACRPLRGLTILQGNHAATFRGTRHPAVITTALEIRHFPYRSVQQLTRKARNGAAAYSATDLPGDAGAHWRSYGKILAERGESGIAELFHQWFWHPDPAAADSGLVRDPVR